MLQELHLLISMRSDVEHATDSTQRGRGAREGPVGRVEGGPGRRSDLKLAGSRRGGEGASWFDTAGRVTRGCESDVGAARGPRGWILTWDQHRIII